MGFRVKIDSEKGSVKVFQEGTFEKALRRQKHAVSRVPPPSRAPKVGKQLDFILGAVLLHNCAATCKQGGHR